MTMKSKMIALATANEETDWLKNLLAGEEADLVEYLTKELTKEKVFTTYKNETNALKMMIHS